MARLKRSSQVVETARHRLAGLRSLPADTDLGAGLSRAEIEAQIKGVEDTLDEYNTLLSSVDEVKNKYEDLERRLRTTNVRILSAIEGKFGPDSTEYEQCGGVRQSDRKRPARRSKSSGGAGSPSPA